MKLKIYLIRRNERIDYDEFDAIVVIAKDRKSALQITPYPNEEDDNSMWAWAKPDKLTAEFIGYAKAGSKPGLVLGSFNAG